MKQLCNSLEIFLVSDIQSIEDTTVNLKDGRASYRFFTDDFELDLSDDSSDPGLLYGISQDIVADKPTSLDKGIFHYVRSAVILFNSVPGNKKIRVGSVELPAKVTLSAQLNKVNIHIEAKMEESPFPL